MPDQDKARLASVQAGAKTEKTVESSETSGQSSGAAAAQAQPNVGPFKPGFGSGFKPFAKDMAKQARYDAFLALLKQGKSGKLMQWEASHVLWLIL